jgi:serine/threonine protein kinase/predicted ATPase
MPEPPQQPGGRTREDLGEVLRPAGDKAECSQSREQSLEATSIYTPKPETDHMQSVPPARPDGSTPGSDAQAKVKPGPLPPAFGRYEVRNILGKGAFGIVYLGHDTQLDRPVAIKVRRAQSGAGLESVEQFLGEARRVARLRHPGIVTVHDVGVQENEVYIVSDYIAGTSLRQWLDTQRPTWQEAARITAAMADALAHAHAQLTVHRDVKPANIILTPDRQPVLVDFGLGIDDSGAGSYRRTSLGTPRYMSPEQFAGEAHRIDGRTDIYSLGVVLYEMLCGLLPFRVSESAELRRQVCEDEPQPPRQLAGDLPRELERICLKALAKRMQDRYTTAADFADELRGVLAKSASQTAAPPAGLTLASPSSETPASQGSVGGTDSSIRRARRAERRQITILCCGCATFKSEEYLERLDDEDKVEVLRAFQQMWDAAINRFEGITLQSTDEGIVACFGYPIAHEDAVRRAARAALGILEATVTLNQTLQCKYKLTLAPWLGIHTGFAVAEITAEHSVSVVGEARNIAARLGDMAEPGAIVCTDAAERLIHGYFDCDSLGRHKIKGVSQPVALHRVKGESGARSAIDVALPVGLTPLTGRDHEVNLLKDRWEQAQEGMGQIVLIIGEAGLGKSRLVYTMKQHIDAVSTNAASSKAERASQTSSARALEVQNAPTVEWRCSPQSQNSGLFPAVDFFERFLGFGREESPDQKFTKLVSHLEEYERAEPDVVPLLASLLSLPVGGRFPPLNLSPVRQKERTLEVLQQWLRSYSARQPVLFVVEDLHWVDASTLEFLTLFVNQGLHDRVLTLLTFRPEFKTPWPAVAHQTSLALTRLTRRQIAEMMRKKTGIENISDTLVQQVVNRTSGVPLFVEEFTRMIQESGMLEKGADESGRARPLAPREIPATLQDLVMARLDRIASDKEVVQLGATLGREFSHELLAAVSPLPAPELEAELAKLVQAELLYQKGRPPRCTYVFKHALLEDAAYNSLVRSKRQLFHQRIGEVLEARFAQTTEIQPELLAHHFTEAGLTRKAVDYWLKAGLRCRARSAEVEAIGHLTKGIELIEHLDASRERDELELSFQSQLGTAYLSTRGYAAPEVGPCFLRARALCERVGQPEQLFAVMWGTWAWHVVRGDFRLCMDLAAEAMELAAKLNDPGIMMEALFTPGLTMLYRAEFAGARDNCGKAVAEFDDRERTKTWAVHTGQNSSVTHRCYLSLALWHLGFPDQALARNLEMVELARAVGHPFSLTYALHHTGWLHQHCRLGVEAQAAGEEEIQIATEQGFAFWQATGTLYRAAGLLQQGHRQAALPLLVKGLSAYRATGAGLALPFYYSILGDAYTQAGNFDEALKVLDNGLAIADKNDDWFQYAELHRLKGELLRLRSPDSPTEAESCFVQALNTARLQGSKSWELRVTMSLCRLWQEQGRRSEAYRALSQIYGWFTEGFSTPDLMDAKALLEELGS